MNALWSSETTASTSELEESLRTAPLRCQGLRKSFGANEVLCGVDLTIPPGSVVGLVGTNGSGKSTLIKCLLGLLKPAGGQATLFGEDSWFLSAKSKQNLGHVPQVVQLYPWMRVQQMVEYTSSFYENWNQDWTDTLLDRLELPRDHRIGPLSTGQLQKLALVLALGHRPELLILDEPVASLDPIARRELLRSLIELTLDHNHTVLFSTHITSDLERVASHIALLSKGRIALFDELDAVKERVKRLRLKSTDSLPPTLDIPGAIRTHVDGDEALVTVTDASNELLAQVRDQYHAEVSVEDLNLEEIFVELHQQ